VFFAAYPESQLGGWAQHDTVRDFASADHPPERDDLLDNVAKFSIDFAYIIDRSTLSICL